MRRMAMASAGLALVCGPMALAVGAGAWWQTSPPSTMSQSLRERVMDAVSAARLRAVHELLASEPHVAGTEGDQREINRIATLFRRSGLAVDVFEFWPYLAQPISAQVDVITLDDTGKETRRIMLSLKERDLVEDPHSSDPTQTIGFNAYSGSGAATGEVVYAHHGTREDFAKLAELGVNVRGKIVLARYGGNFRGYKAKYAEEVGAKGLIIYTDPADGGFTKGATYPEGGWANESYIQRGSILTTPYPGDPLTPFIAATHDAPRLDVRTVALPKIPVQPIGYGAAREILQRMQGEASPVEWKGGFDDVPYALTGGAKLLVSMDVEQKRSRMRTANVIGVLRGAVEPDKYVIVGCHHDAWCCGAADPLAGTMVLMECARVFGEAAQSGLRPARTIIFAAWGAEEFGIIGSTEWCEANADMLMRGGVAYINLDMASMGLQFGSSASPSLRSAIAHAAGLVLQPEQSAMSVLSAWSARKGDDDSPLFGSLGGGSDHVAFYCRLGIPSCEIGGGGSEGTSYHSIYDTPAWYQKVVGEDYASAKMVAQVCAALLMDLADSPIMPIDPRDYAEDGSAKITTLEARAEAMDVAMDSAPLTHAIEAFQVTANEFVDAVSATDFTSVRGAQAKAKVNATLRSLEQAWLAPQGLPERPWYASLYGAPDPYSGYAAWVFPALRLAIEEQDASAAAEAIAQLVEVYDAMRTKLQATAEALPSQGLERD